ncbi:MAG: SDR family NAD(P)-dependent oxidoreductase [Methyloligellaceae bacterium]
MELKNRTILITGGTSGIGRELVSQLYPHNKIITISRPTEKLAELANAFPGITIYPADLSRIGETTPVSDTIRQNHNQIDILINNAAVQYTPTFLDKEFALKTIQEEITLNFTAICELTYLLMPLLLQSKEAAILNINSGLGLLPKTTSAVYCGTKGALNIFSQSLRYQLEKTNIHVMQAFMPLVDTQMTEGRGTKKMTREKAASQIIKGLRNNHLDNNIGKVKLLRLLMRLLPSTAANIMKRA